MQGIKSLIHKKIALAAFITWTVLNVSGIQDLYMRDGDPLKMVPLKLLHLLFLYVIFYKINSLYQHRKEPKGKAELVCFGICFGVYALALLLAWPGAWSWDDITILTEAAFYATTPWQHFLSGTFHVLCLQTLPFAAGVIILQALIIAFIAGYCTVNLSELFGKTEKQKQVLRIILLAIMFFPPIVMYVLSGFRMGLYAFFELLLIAKLLILFKNGKQASTLDLAAIITLGTLLAAWRTEAIYLPIAIFVLLLLLGKRIMRKSAACIALLLMLFCVFAIGKYNNHLIGNNNYSLTATMTPVTEIIRLPDGADAESLAVIDKVIDVEFIRAHTELNGEQCYWAEGCVRNYSDEDYSAYLKTFLKLCIKNPSTVLKSNWNTFCQAVGGFGQDGKQTTRNAVFTSPGGVFEIDPNNPDAEWHRVNSILKYPADIELRQQVILGLGGVDADRNLTVIHNVFWSLFIPLGLMLIALVYKLIKKDWFTVILMLTVLCRVPILFMTSPAPYFMYYLSVYLCCYVLSVSVLFEWINDILEKKRMRIKS